MTEEKQESTESEFSVGFMLVVLAFVAATVWLYMHVHSADCDEGNFCVPQDGFWNLSHTLSRQSINGLYRIQSVDAMLRLDGVKKSIPLKVTPRDSHDWGLTITTEGVGSLLDNTDPMALRLRFDIPPMLEHVGAKGVIAFSGRVTYPKAMGSSQFENTFDGFEKTVDVQLIKARISKWWTILFWVMAVLSAILSLFLIASLLPSEGEKPEGGEGTPA